MRAYVLSVLLMLMLLVNTGEYEAKYIEIDGRRVTHSLPPAESVRIRLDDRGEGGTAPVLEYRYNSKTYIRFLTKRIDGRRYQTYEGRDYYGRQLPLQLMTRSEYRRWVRSK